MRYQFALLGNVSKSQFFFSVLRVRDFWENNLKYISYICLFSDTLGQCVRETNYSRSRKVKWALIMDFSLLGRRSNDRLYFRV